jgi:ABC-type phosphate transport system permease subunit
MRVTESMSTAAGMPPLLPAVEQPAGLRRRRYSAARSLLAQGEPLIWLTGGALVLGIAMILGLLVLVITLGVDTFRTRPVVRVELLDGRVLMGEVSKSETFLLTADTLLSEPPEVQQGLVAELARRAGTLDNLMTQLDHRRQQLQVEAQQLQARIERQQQRITSLALNRRQATTPLDRANAVAHDPVSRQLHQARTQLVALEQRAESLRSELQLAEQAADHFRRLPRIDAQAILQADPSLRPAGVEALIALVRQAGEAGARFRRRMLRTGNFELTNEHFSWVADYQIAADGESRPRLATLVERVAWGRFYGIPQTFWLKQVRPLSIDERELAAIIDFWRLHQAEQPAGDEAQQARRAELLEELQREQARQRVDATRAFIADLAPRLTDGQRLVLLTEDGQEKAADRLTPEDVVVATVVVTEDAELAWQEFERVHPQVLAWQRRRQQLEKHDLGNLFADQEATRLRVRQAELDFDLSLMPEATGRLQAESALANVRDAQAAAHALVHVAQRRYGKSSELAMTVAQLYEAADFPRQRTDAQATLNANDTLLAMLPPEARAAVERYVEVEHSAAASAVTIQEEIEDLRQNAASRQLHLVTADGQTKALEAGDVVRAFQPNRLSSSAAWSVYLARWWEFLTADPREANSEGGVFPAICGTVVMTLVMSLAVVPFGVVAALYLREYAKSGPIVSVIRIAINNLAGVPSIVFGVFGLGFFCYIIGAYLDGGPQNAGFEPLPPTRWYAILGVLAVAALSAFVCGLIGLSGRRVDRGRVKRWLAMASLLAWLAATAMLVMLIAKSPFFNGFYAANLPNPYWGKGGLIWASLTLALMTLPVVIVATEEALAAVPNSMREGSYACGAGKWQTIRRIVLPHAMPGIMTGMILAMARGAGEVAPLMLVGAVKLAPELPIDTSFPFLHGNRSFMHLGFHIFDVGFQSQNSEAAKPMVYTTTLLLIVIITVMNLLAVWLRAYLRKRFAAGEF